MSQISPNADSAPRNDRALTLCLALIAAAGPFAMDTYLAAMPTMSKELGGQPGEIELTVTSFFIGFCLGQLILGPVSDKIGRKPVALGALALFGMASAGCIWATTVSDLFWLRMLQGFGGSTGMMLAMSAVRDRYTGINATKMIAMILAILGIAPVIAPIVGGLVIQYLPWRAIFAFLTCFAGIALVLLTIFMPETTVVETRAQSRPFAALSNYARLLTRKDYIPYAAAMALTQASLFCYIAGASPVMISTYGMPPLLFACSFAVNAVGLTIVSRFGPRMTQRLLPSRAARYALTFRMAVALSLLVLQLTGLLSMPAFLVHLFLLISSLGIAMPACSVLALDKHGHIAGTASALMGSLGFALGAVASAALGVAADGTALPLVGLLALVCCAAALTTVFFQPQNDSSV